MQEMTFLQDYQNSTKRDYIARVLEDKPHCVTVAKQFEKEYWDGHRRYGYGGYKYDGRWKTVAEKLIKHYKLTDDFKILDIGCGKGHLISEIKKQLKWATVKGCDISRHAIKDAQPNVKINLKEADCAYLPYPTGYFDFVLSINVFHNLRAPELKKALSEMNRVTKDGGKQYICVESWETEAEKCNLLNWQLTAESLHDIPSWRWLFKEYDYHGDREFIVFE